MRYFLSLLFIISFMLYGEDTNTLIEATNIQYTTTNDIVNNSTNDTNTFITNDLVIVDNTLYINLEDALRLALENDKQLKQAEYDVRIAQAQKDATFSDIFLPQLSISGGVNLKEPTEYQGTGIDSSIDNYSATATLSKQLFSGFRNLNLDKAQALNLQMKKDTYYDMKKNVDINTMLSFYNTFIAEENYNVYRQSQRNYSNRMNYTYIQYRNGQVSEYDYLTSKVQYENTKPQLIKLSNQYQTLKLTFLRQIGVTNLPYDVEIVGNILDATNITLPPNLSEDDLITIIMRNNIDIKNMASNLEMLEYNRKVASSYLWPTITGSANVGISTVDKVTSTGLNTYKKERDSDFTWGVSFTLNYSLDSLLPFSSTAKKAEEAELNIKKLEVSYDELRDNIEVNSRDLISLANSQALTLDSQAENAKTAAYALQMAERQYRGGSISQLEVQDAEINYLNAQLSYLQAIYDYFSSTLQVLKLLSIQ